MDGIAASVLTGVVGLLLVAGVLLLFLRLAKQQGVKAQAGLPASWEKRAVGGAQVELRYQPPRHGKHSHPSVLSLRAPTAAGLHLQISREGWFDRMCKLLGIAQEFQTGDREFDAAWYLRGEVDARAGMALRHGELRGQLKQLLALGFTGLQVEGGYVQADWAAFDPARNPLPGDAAGSALAAIAAGLPAGASSPTPRRHAAAIALWLCVLGIGGCFVLGIAYPPVRGWDLWRLVLPVAVLAWCMFAWIAAFALRGRSRSHDQWLLLVLTALLTCTLGARGLIGWWNGYADPAPLVVHEATVEQLWTKRRKNRTTYWLAVADWRGSDTLRYKIARDQYASLRTGASRVIAHTRAGRLGVEWQESWRVVP
ncbi:MAG: hypothetical protein IT479_14225 [Xanthomonadales bacterium]|nr:hypothetical protein [Xanthomonadales bacterium]MCC6594418.1 hypothetical protein [Xanthomonadales bacterium]MCE7931627.1 hypothetical protein [Xanthomonadales bacterium PRO6]